jgi:hypothetical protein
MDKMLIAAIAKMFVEMLADVAIRHATEENTKEDILSEMIERIKESISGESKD